MTGIVYPNLVGTLAPLLQLEQNDRRNALAERAFAREEEDRAREREAAVDVPAALAGDKEALGRVSAKSPKTAFTLAPLLERLDTAQRTKAKEASEYTVQAGMAILSAPPEQQPQLYARARQDAQARGLDVSRWPTQYDPGFVKFYVDKAMPIAEFYKRQNEGGEPVGFPGGGVNSGPPAQAPGKSAETGKQFVSYLTTKYNLPPMAAAGIVGGLFQESGFDPGYGFTRPGGDNGTAHGIAQWRNDRAQGLRSFAQQQGKQPTDPYLQLDYLVNEMKGGDMGAQRAYAMLQQAKTPEEATTAMMHFFRPAGYTPNNPQGGHGYTQRVQYAQQFAPPPAAIPEPPPGMSVRGAAPAQMPAPPAGITPPGRPLAQMPGMPPGLAQGDNLPADGSGNPLPPRPELGGYQAQELTQYLPPGARYVRDKGSQKLRIQDGIAEIQYPDGQRGWLRLPPKKEAGTGPFAGTSTEAQALNMLIANGTLTQQQAAELAAGKTITNPADGSVLFMTPSGIFQRPAGGTGGAPPTAASGPVSGPSPPPVAPPPSGMIPITPPKPEKLTEGQAKAYGFAQRMATANTLLDDLAIQGTSKRGRFLEGLPGGIGNIAQTPEFQRFEQAKRNFMNAQLRDESGAVIGPSEFMSADLQYFPQPGQETNKELLAQMAENRRQVVEAMMIKAGMLKRGERYEPPAKAVDGAEKGRLVFEAKKAIQEGRDPNGVREKLKKLGVDPAELDGAN